MELMTPGRYQFVLPSEVDGKLEGLRLHATLQGNKVSRSDVVAALIWGATVDGDELGVMIRLCRREVLSSAPSPKVVRPPGPQSLSKRIEA